MKREALGAAGIAAIAAVVLPLLDGGPPIVFAYPNCPVDPNYYAFQYATKGYKGQFGWLYTFVPSVPDYNNDFSLSHLYSFTPRDSPSQPIFQHGDWFVEVGWYQGYGTQLIAYPYPRYYTAKQDSTWSYTELNFGEAVRNTHVDYEIQYVGYDYGNNRYKWSVYADNLGSPLQTWEHKDMATGVPSTGGEVNEFANSGTQMRTDVIPNHQLKDSNGNWNNWTPSYMTSQSDSTSACDDLSFTFTWDAQYQDFRVTGSR